MGTGPDKHTQHMPILRYVHRQLLQEHLDLRDETKEIQKCSNTSRDPKPKLQKLWIGMYAAFDRMEEKNTFRMSLRRISEVKESNDVVEKTGIRWNQGIWCVNQRLRVHTQTNTLCITRNRSVLRDKLNIGRIG